jgi:hypothetical protein
MTTRAQRLLTTALSKTGLSYEDFALQYSHAVAWKSPRQLRRYAKGEAEIPPYVTDSLRRFLSHLTSPTE